MLFCDSAPLRCRSTILFPVALNRVARAAPHGPPPQVEDIQMRNKGSKRSRCNRPKSRSEAECALHRKPGRPGRVPASLPRPIAPTPSPPGATRRVDEVDRLDSYVGTLRSEQDLVRHLRRLPGRIGAQRGHEHHHQRDQGAMPLAMPHRLWNLSSSGD